jgi:hypothetical protein
VTTKLYSRTIYRLGPSKWDKILTEAKELTPMYIDLSEEMESQTEDDERANLQISSDIKDD